MRKLRVAFIGAGLLLTAALLWTTGAAIASHIFGRTYTGSLSGTPGGTVTVAVASNGTTADITHDSAGIGCGARTFEDVPIASSTATHTFTGSSGVSQVSGSFAANGVVSGTITSLPAGTACDLTNVAFSAAAQATATPTPTPTRTPTRTPIARTTLPRTGSPAAVIGLSGLTALEAGFGLRMLSRRLQMPMRAVPVYLLRRLVRAERRGEDGVEVADGWYLMRRPDGQGD